MKVIKKSKVDPEDARRSIYKLYHFHIEAFDESITLSKMDKDLNVLSEEKVPKQGKFSQMKQRPCIQTNQFMSLDSDENKAENESILISKDILDQSPDVKRFSKRKAMFLDYMEKIKENIQFRLNPTLMNDDKKTQQSERKTVLCTREVDDNEIDFIAMEMHKFRKLSNDVLPRAFKQIMRAIKPVFSGNVETQINKLNYEKVKSKL